VSRHHENEEQGCFGLRDEPTRRDFGALAASALLGIGATPVQSPLGPVDPKDTVLECGWALVAEGPGDLGLRLIRDAQIRVRRGRIEEVRASRVPGTHRLALPHDLVLPGFISGHTHVASIEGGRAYRRPIERELPPDLRR